MSRRPTITQHLVLQQLARASRFTLLREDGYQWYQRPDNVWVRMHPRTLAALLAAGWLEAHISPAGYPRYLITAAGRRAIGK